MVASLVVAGVSATVWLLWGLDGRFKDIQNLTTEVGGLKTEVMRISESISGLNAAVAVLNDRTTGLPDTMIQVHERLAQIEDQLERNTTPVAFIPPALEPDGVPLAGYWGNTEDWEFPEAWGDPEVIEEYWESWSVIPGLLLQKSADDVGIETSE